MTDPTPILTAEEVADALGYIEPLPTGRRQRAALASHEALRAELYDTARELHAAERRIEELEGALTRVVDAPDETERGKRMHDARRVLAAALTLHT